MAWHPIGRKLLSKPMMAWLLTYISELVQERCHSIANALELHLSCTNPLIYVSLSFQELTHWGQVMHICISKLTIMSSDNGLSPGRHQAIIWTNAGILLIRTLGTNFSEILGVIHSFSFSKMHLKMSSAKWRLFGLSLNELISVVPLHAVYMKH